MSEGWPWAASTTSLAGLLGMVVMAIVFGLLIPRWVHNQQVKFWKQRYDDAMKIVDSERTRNDKLTDTVSKLLVYAETADRVLKALPTHTERSAS